MFKSIFSMQKMIFILLGAMLFFVMSTMQAYSVPVTYENYVKVQTSLQIDAYQKLAKGINKLYHFRVPTPIENQPTIRMNHDTLYSVAMLNVSRGVVISIPDTGNRYISLAVSNELGYTNFVYYGKGTYTLTSENVGSDYALIAIRTLVDAGDKKDIMAVNALQDKIMIEAKDNTVFKLPNWDMKSYKTIYDSLLGLFALAPNTKNMFGKEEDVNPVLFLLGAAGAFGGLPEKDAVYFNITPKQKGKSFTITVKDVPVDGFWSVTVYNKEGYLFDSPYGLSSINNLTASPVKDGTYTLYFGNCEKYKKNCLAIEDGWNYIVRLYQPREEIISGKWTFPPLKPI